MKPFLKWAGSKYRIVNRIQELLPQGKRLIEPFCGSAAVFLNTRYETYWLNDINKDLINLYRTLQSEGLAFIEYAKLLFVPENNCAEAYYRLRQEFNQTTDSRYKAALFVFLNKHGYNGLCRYNASGGFNVPFGRYVKPYFPEAEMRFFCQHAQRAVFQCADFEEIMVKAGEGDVVYCDPPYVPLSPTANFTNYSAGGFGQEQQLRLAELARELSHRGVSVIISNHCNEFTKQAYAGAKLTVFEVQRYISCDGANRNKATELLAMFAGRSAHVV